MLVTADDKGVDLAFDLVTNGLLAEEDKEMVSEKIKEKLCQYESNPPQPPSSPLSETN